MIKQFAGIITSFLVRDNVIDEEQKEIYQYGTEQLLINAITLCAICIIAISLEARSITVLWLLGFLPIRAVAGGYHADTPLRCNALTLAVYLINMSVILYLSKTIITYKLLVVTLSVAFLGLLMFAPVDHKNRVLLNEDYFQAKTRSRIIGILIISFCLFVAIVIGPESKYSLSTTLGVLTASISLAIGSIKRGGERNEKINET